MPKFESMPSRNPFCKSSKRRPTGVSRSDKYRQLRIELLERREVMSANTVSTVVNYTADEAAMRYQMLDNDVLTAFEKASNLAQYTQQQLASATQWVILADLGSNLADEIAAGGFKLDGATGIIPGALYVSPGSGGLQAMIDALGASADIDYFYPLINHAIEQNSVTNDPYLQFQWHLINFGQLVGGIDASFLRGVPGEDINIEGAWDLATGAGVQIGIVDTGVEMDHPDLADNVRTDLAVNLGGGGGPLFSGHGTAVAGLAAGVGNNGIGTTGVAYEADIVPIRLFSGDPLNSFVSDASVATSLIYQFQQIDVYNHSWGLVPANPRQMIDLGPLSLTALRNSVFFGRGGKGSIHVVAAGNDGSGTSSQYDGFNNSRYTIGVTAVDHDGIAPNADGTTTSYPESGPDTLVSAPSGSVSLEIIRDTGLGSGIWTTDLTGNDGYNQGPDENGLDDDLDYFQDTDYASRFSGTSAAAPIVTGVIALMLEANPNLTYRDVQHILVRAARQSNPNDASWQVNQREFQLDPLPPVDYGTGIFDPDSLWPFSPEYLVPQLEPHFENGAGFTVSQTFGSYSLGGYAHGMIDASVAVELARNWRTVGNQQSEFNWTTGPTLAGKVWGREVSSDETGQFLIPGGITGDGDNEKGFGDYYNAFGEEDGFVDDEGNPQEDLPIPDRDGFGIPVFEGGGLSGIPILDVPSMTVEWVEVKLNLGGTPEDLNFLRIALVSPDGTVSELIGSGQNVARTVDHFDGNTSFGTTDTLGRTNNLIFSTNRHWGERSEAKFRVDATGQPILDHFDNPILDTWRLVFENYGDADINIQDYEVVFHGSNAANTGRIQGTIGIDENADGFFSGTNDFTHGPNIDRESFAAGVIVYVDQNQDGVRDSTEAFFQTGNDGNYYFDIPAGTYDIRIDGENLPADLDNLQNRALAANAPISVVTVGVGERFSPNNSPAAEAQALNITLMPNAASTITTFDISGVIVADLDRDGVDEATDGVIAGAEVYLDVNQNGVYDAVVDRITTSAADGSYSFVGVEAPEGFYSVVVVEGTTGAFFIPSFPAIPGNGSRAVFVQPGDSVTGINIGFESIPPDEPPPVPLPGAVSGFVFLDNNNSGANEGEPGAAGVTIYIDADGDNIRDAGETFFETGPSGVYTFNNLAPLASYSIRIEDKAGFARTSPPGGEYNTFLLSGQVVSGLNFGIRNLATNDFGDLPNSFGGNSASHALGSPFFLGDVVDGELAAVPTIGADGDNATAMDDEDGVVFPGDGETGALGLGSTWSFQVTANTTGGYLTAWADFNGNGTFEASERLTLKTSDDSNGTNKKLLQSGVNELYVDVPAAALAANGTGHVYVRFRYGEFDIDSFAGPALRGEVEDYRAPIYTIDPGVNIIHGPDFNEDGKVNGRDLLIWQRGFGITQGATAAQGDADSDGDVDADDLQMWRDEYGTNSSSGLAASTAVDEPTFDQEWLDSYFATALQNLRDQHAAMVASSVEVQSVSGGNVTSGEAQSLGPVATSVDASAHSSTFGGLNQSMLVGLASELDKLFDSPNQEAESTVEIELADIDAAFDAGDDSLALPAICGEEDDIAPPFVAGEEVESEEDAAFESAFAEVDWLLI